MLLPTTLVGSYPQPEWLIDHAKLAGRCPPRVHTKKQANITVPGPFTMLQQGLNDFYASEEEAAMDYAAAVNEEIRDLLAAGADYVQVDEPYMQARPEKARQYGLKALNHALAGITGTTIVHICFGYAAIIHERPSGYSFLPEVAACRW